jgi:hypothetical protein
MPVIVVATLRQYVEVHAINRTLEYEQEHSRVVILAKLPAISAEDFEVFLILSRQIPG